QLENTRAAARRSDKRQLPVRSYFRLEDSPHETARDLFRILGQMRRQRDLAGCGGGERSIAARRRVAVAPGRQGFCIRIDPRQVQRRAGDGIEVEVEAVRAAVEAA